MTRQSILQERLSVDAVYSKRQMELAEAENKILHQAKQNLQNEIVYLKSQIKHLQEKLQKTEKLLLQGTYDQRTFNIPSQVQ
jgi:peptidoglycan hydrolase CwlO-like protein